MSALLNTARRFLNHYGLPSDMLHRQSPDIQEGTPASGYTLAVQAFLKELDKDPKSGEEIRSLFSTSAEQAKNFNEWADQSSEYKVEDFDDLVQKLDKIVGGPPKFSRLNLAGSTITGLPVFLLFDLISNTPVGYRLLCRDDVIAALHALMTEWGNYLTTEVSSVSLTDKEDGWFSAPALVVLESSLGDLKFDETYVTELKKPQRYRTWDSFFTRVFKEKRPDGTPVRPIIPQRDNKPFFIYNPCESTVLCQASDVQHCNKFCVKGQNYSLHEMMGCDKRPNLASYAADLQGGSILLSYLSPQDYHRWHSPIAGTVLAAHIVNGTIYADERALEGDVNPFPADPHAAMVRLQPWLNLSSTRGVFIMKPVDANAHIDLVALIAIGMVDVSSCEITYDKRTTPHPEQVEVGTELGMFHFGGSAYALVVKPEKGYKVVFQDDQGTLVSTGKHCWIHSVVAQVCSENEQPEW